MPLVRTHSPPCPGPQFMVPWIARPSYRCTLVYMGCLASVSTLSAGCCSYSNPAQKNVKCIILFYYFYDHEMIVTMSPYRHRWWWCWSCIHRKVAVLQALHSVSLLTSLHPSPGLHLTMWLKRLRVAKGAKMWLSYVPSRQPLLCTGYFICSLFILT